MGAVDSNIWPDDKLNAADVRAWIASNFPDTAAVSGPLHIYRQNHWALTAGFGTYPTTRPGSDSSTGYAQAMEREASRQERVVFKASFLPTNFAVAKAYDLVARSCSHNVPELIAWREDGGQRWMLFREFTGDLVASLPDGEALADVARTIAKIQLAVSRVPESALSLPRISIRDITLIYDEMVEDIRSKYQSIWFTDQGALLKKYGLSATTLEMLMGRRDIIGRYADLLDRIQLPMSIVHADLDETNSVIQGDGEILIFDWDTSVMGCAFFALDKLLADARSRDLKSGLYQAANASEMPFTRAERSVRDAYLEEYEWSTRSERETAFDMAIRLAPLYTAHSFKRFAEAVGLGLSMVAEYTAWCVARAEYRLQ